MQHNFKLKILIFIILMCVSARANAADIRLITESGGSYRAIVIEGKIEAGDFEKFINIVRDNQGIVSGVYIFSPGGDYYEAMKIGRAMRALELSSTVPMNESGRPSCEGLLQQPRYPENCICASAGFFIHIGSVWRSGTYLAVHRPYFEKGKFGELPEAEAKKEFDKLLNSSRDYMTEMGVPKHIQDDVLGTSSDQALVLDEKTVKTYFWLDLPYRHEWLKNKFSKLSDEEKSRDDGYTQRLIKSGYSYARANLSKEEQADLEILRKKKQEESNCRLLFDRQNRISAYEKYFNIKLSYDNNYFSQWVSASQYLGKSFEEILKNREFKETVEYDNDFHFDYLERFDSTRAPYTVLHDSLDSKVVADLRLSASNSSQEFVSRLVKTIENAWGKGSVANGPGKWQWNKEKFTGELAISPDKSNPGTSYVSLKVKGNDAFYDKGNYDQSISYYTRAIEQKPNDAMAYNTRGIVFDKQGKHDQAIADYTKAIEIDPNFVDAYRNRGIVYKGQDNYAQAIADFTKAIEIEPKYADAYYRRGLVYAKQGNTTQSISDYSKAIDLSPKNVDIYNTRGVAYYEQNSLDQAMSDFNKAIEINPNSVEAYNNRAHIYDKQGKQADAMSDITKVIEINPNDAEAHINRGGAYCGQGDYDRAIADFTKALELKPNDSEVYCVRGFAYAKQGNPTQAIVDLTKAIEINPKYVAAYNYRASVYYMTKRYDEAWADVHKQEELKNPAPAEFLEKLKKASGRDK